MSSIHFRRAQAISVPFMVGDPLNPGYGKDGLTWAAGDVKIVKLGAAANTTNLPVAVTSPGTHKGLYSIDLISTETNLIAGLLSIQHASGFAKPIDLESNGDPVITVVANGGNTALTFKTDRTETGTDYWKNVGVSWQTGALANQLQFCTAYDGTTKFITVAGAFTAAPSAGDIALLVNI